MEHFVTFCEPILGRRKLLYRVWRSFRALQEVKPRRGRVVPYLILPTDRIIQRGAIINPTRELKRYLRAKQRAELMDIWRKAMLHFAGAPFDPVVGRIDQAQTVRLISPGRRFHFYYTEGLE